jgi:hypothetical protein
METGWIVFFWMDKIPLRDHRVDGTCHVSDISLQKLRSKGLIEDTSMEKARRLRAGDGRFERLHKVLQGLRKLGITVSKLT